ncbi:hypothetical protein JQU17_04065 [Ponticoccus sp. SC2-23]|uniref:hypothetical protein n=1 Tax=Alexandriicola marinus TaxID=2081710 RepID=UPI000FDAE0CA|nr:hypothetical protein [Alexandriicola marinus]MBM1219361.1 hypothetical protein [Ponticoccus sp. SC6-9]MBM1223567.1 hypothetical protein [Ponticoccus sp. SC6-15]MBM1229174.1 hypothetical protein [Ponticoccus sp. SC6-38]MBM1232533.1 hypothetical protein [Ponticoccus sp. SC6-45]MBM1237517.1 hypothetical protein [Ponticoccus sp. SC6-49]MBM1241544.1 hypothetical protein [Ponticoccus sp. SC2-64]MBM1246057.1 hypothetical protein [Ponticoccus sp. SC6-42]MBM1250535.1 hypothetical protein [Pontico
MSQDQETTQSGRNGLRQAREIEGHLGWLDGFTGAALAVLAVASGIYTYLGVSSLLDDTGAMSAFAAMAYSVAVSVGIFVFWSYMLRLLPAMRTMASRLGLMGAMGLGCVAIIAMSSWLNAAALAGAAAVEQHLAVTVQRYQGALERANTIAISAQSLERDVARLRQSFEDLSEQEASGELSGFAGQGAVFRLLRQKSDELAALEAQIATQDALVAAAFAEGNETLSRMRALTVAPGPVETRSVQFSEEAVRLANVITRLRQLSVAPLVRRSALDLSQSVILPQLDGSTEDTRAGQQATIDSVRTVLAQRADTLRLAAESVMSMEQPEETVYTPISAADAVILYAGNFVPSWAGAIAIDLLPAVLVFITAIAQAAIRSGRETTPVSDQLTLAELRAAMAGIDEIERQMDHAQTLAHSHQHPESETEADRPPPQPTEAGQPWPQVSAIDPGRRGE